MAADKELDLSGRIKDVKNLIQELDEGIISTWSAERIGDEAAKVEDDYKVFARNHVQVTDTSDYQSKLIDTIEENDEPTKGFIYGPYGHGKTSIMVKLWSDLEEENIVAVPPFTFSSFTDLRDALYGWLHYKLTQEASEEEVKNLEKIHSKYISDALEERLEDRFGDEYEGTRLEEFKEMFRELSDSDDMNLEISPKDLIDFFDECTDLAKDAGYDGLIILPDELQQFLSSSGSRDAAVAKLRNLIFDLIGGNHIDDDFGIVFSMPRRTKSRLDDQAADIINRLQKDGLDLNLETVYGKDFSKKLWAEYAEKFGFDDERYEIISERCFEAIGQITTRDDLSGGPRTVIDIFRIAINNYIDNQQTFNSLDLGDAYYRGDIRYSGDNEKIRKAIENTIRNSNVDSEEKEKVVKLCAMFPEEGLQDDAKDEYGISETVDELSKELHGELMTRVTNGHTLVGVTRDNRTTDIEQETVRDFINQFDENSHFAGKQCESFCKHILEKDLLESKRGMLKGWSIDSGRGFQNFKGNSYSAIFNGTYNKNFPDRNLYVKVTDSEKEGNKFEIKEHEYSDPVDLRINFILDWQGERQSKIVKKDTDKYLIYLDTTNHQDQIPDQLQSLSESVRPKDLSPFLMMSLIEYIDGVKENEGGQNKSQLEGLQGRIISVVEKALLVEEKVVENSELDLTRRGGRLLEGVFNESMQELYPNYHTFKSNKQFRKFIEDYKTFLRNLETPSERKGDDIIEDDNNQKTAERLGRSGVAGLENRFKDTYSDLVEVKNWDSSNVKLQLRLHPFENEILSLIDEDGEKIDLESIYDRGKALGYRMDEIKLIWEVLEQRGMIEEEEVEGRTYLKKPAYERSISDLEDKLDQAEEKLETLNDLGDQKDGDKLKEELTQIKEEIESLDKEDKERVQNLYASRLSPLVNKIEGDIKTLHNSYIQKCRQTNNNLEKLGNNLIKRPLKDEIEAQVAFVKNLNQARIQVKREFQELQNQIDDEYKNFSSKISKYDSETAENTKKLRELEKEIETEKEDLKNKKLDLESKLDQLRQWKAFTTRVGNISDNIMTHAATFEEEIESEEDIEKFESDVKQKFSEDLGGGLNNLESFRQRFDDIQDAFEQSRKSKKEQFDKSKENLNDLLDDILPRGGKKIRKKMNLDNPERSRKELMEAFRNKVKDDLLNDVKEDLRKSSNDLGVARLKGVDVESKQIETTEKEIEDSKRQVDECRTQLSGYGYYDIGNENEENQLKEDLDNLWQQVEGDEGIKARTKEFLRPKDVSESKLQSVLDRLDAGSTKDLKEILLESSEEEDISVDEYLDRIKELFQKNQVDIKVETRRRR